MDLGTGDARGRSARLREIAVDRLQFAFDTLSRLLLKYGFAGDLRNSPA